MSANMNTQTIDNLLARRGGFTWARLHDEREDICAALLQKSRVRIAGLQDVGLSQASSQRVEWDQCEILQARLRHIDEALDRLMAGTYGECIKCGRWIEDNKLAADPAMAFCLDCQHRVKAYRSSSSH